MKISTAKMCKIGGRDYNQDFIADSVNDKSACFVVCDGLGSYAGSEDASRLCATKIIDQFETVREIDHAKSVKRIYLEAFIENAHNFVVSHKDRNPGISQSCTTVATAITDGNGALFAHIGDSRIYFFKNSKLVYQSKDHSLSQVAVELGQIKLRDIRTHKDQNKLTRVLGSDYFAAPDVDGFSAPLDKGDAFVLCTDGFWEYVYEEEMEEDLSSSATAQEALDKMEQRLLSRIPKFNDNYSVILAIVTESDSIDAQETAVTPAIECAVKNPETEKPEKSAKEAKEAKETKGAKKAKSTKSAPADGKEN
jgi:serine/threonine protein phosphatase PrpC